MKARVPYGARGQGSLILMDGSKNWISCYFVRGKEHRESTGTPDLRKARRYHKQKLDEIAADRQGLRTFIGPVAQRVQVGELLDELEADYRLRQVKGWASFQSHAKPIREFFGAWRAAEITAAVIDRYIAERLEAEKSPGTVNRGLQILGQAFRLGLQRQKINVVPSIRQLPEHNVRQGFFERPEFEALVAALPKYLCDFCRFGYLTGWRKGEIISLKWTDVDRDGGAIRLRPEESKNARGRTVMLEGDLATLMERRWQGRLLTGPDGQPRVVDVIFHRDGEPVGEFRKSWATACIKAGLYHVEKDDEGRARMIPDRLFHDLRRTAIRNMVRAGVPERVAMEVSGHRTRAIFDRYNIVSEADLRSAMQRTALYLDTLPLTRTPEGKKETS